LTTGVRLQTQSPTIRSWIIASIRRILAGEDFTWADWGAQPRDGWAEIGSKSQIVSSDRNPAHSAWIALQWWVNDDDIRAKDPDYAVMRKRQLQALLEKIESDSPD
jgi:hypothetical protein